ncbi:MAG: G5 domain-containing protein [Clostridia bacterium]|nr:G5 domain-containing protein [Clostridia bacterium]
MITNSSSESKASRKRSFKLLTAVIAVLFICSVTFTAFATTNSVNKVTVTDGEKSVSISTAETDPYSIVKAAGFDIEINDEINTKDYNSEDGGTIVIKRAKLVRVEDNGVVSYFLGHDETLGSMLTNKGFVFGSDDEIGANPSENIFDGMKIFIKRAFGIDVESDGETQKVYLAKGTVADAIEKAGISVDEDDIVYPSLDTKLNSFTKIRIVRVKYDIKSEIQEIPYETEIVKDSSMFIGEEKVIKEGVNGEKYAFYSEKYVDGELEETVFSKEKIITEPVNEVKKVGTKQRTTLAAFKNNGAPISDLEAPSDLKLDENGVPVDYEYCISGKATAYTGDPATSTGRKPMPGHIAVDPKEIPYGTELYVVSADGSYVYGYCIAADTGGFVEMGNTDIDLYMDNEDMCCDWGNRNVKIYVLN